MSVTVRYTHESDNWRIRTGVSMNCNITSFAAICWNPTSIHLSKITFFTSSLFVQEPFFMALDTYTNSLHMLLSLQLFTLSLCHITTCKETNHWIQSALDQTACVFNTYLIRFCWQIIANARKGMFGWVSPELRIKAVCPSVSLIWEQM